LVEPAGVEPASYLDIFSGHQTKFITYIYVSLDSEAQSSDL